VTIIDANLLLYAYNADAPQQPVVAKWLDELIRSGETIGLPWVTAWAFVRICTNARIWANPLSARDAFAILGEWWSQPDVITLQPGARYREILEILITEHNATGPLVTDAVLAALAIENGATLASSDQDFARFRRLRWTNPLEGWSSQQPSVRQK
jgi:toxin-antitoxin system PIN domain toxin